MISDLTLNMKLEKLRGYREYLESYRKHSLADLETDYTLQGAVLRYLQLAIECVLDIGEILISELKLPKPGELREVIEVLGKHKILPADFAERLAPIAGFRNILVHEYADVDLERVYKYLQENLKDFDFYAQCIVRFVKSHGAG